MNITQSFLDFIILLNKYKVEYIIVGGYAVGLHGHPRYTADMDFWINKTEANIERVLKAVKEFSGPLVNIDKSLLMKNASATNPAPGIGFGRSPFRIEILSSIEGLSFAECFERAEEKTVHNNLLRYLAYDDLKKNKLNTGRSRDKVDIEELEKIKKYIEEHGEHESGN